MSLFCKATWKEVREEPLDGSKDEYVTHWSKWDDQNNDNGDECYDILECPSREVFFSSYREK